MRIVLVLNRIRSICSPLIEKIGLVFARTGAPPWFWTLVGLLFSMISMSFYFRTDYEGGLLGGVFFLLSGFMDVVDGAVAKSMESVTKLGNFVDSTADRLGEVLVCFGLLVGGWASSDIIFLMVTFSILVSYLRAKGDALGVDLKGLGIGERAERIIVLSFSSIVGYTYYGILLVCILAVFTFLQRSIVIMQKLKK
ncbi:MAG: CDP-alcohol phosphatidyltransferase family protein [Nitrososphaeria archaeon]